MFEKYIGRKQNPPVQVESGPFPEASVKTWQEQVEKNPEFQAWFSGSVVVDRTGRPMPVFHGTRGSRSFDDVYSNGVSELGMHFGTAAAANERFQDTLESTFQYKLTPDWTYETLRDRILKSGLPDAQKQQELDELDQEFTQKKTEHQELVASGIVGGEVIYPVFLRITNPVRLSDPGSFTQQNLEKIKKDLIRNFITRDQVETIKQAKSVDELRGALIELGYDGVVYRNGVEGRDGDSYIPIVGSEQIRPVFQVGAPA